MVGGVELAKWISFNAVQVLKQPDPRLPIDDDKRTVSREEQPLKQFIGNAELVKPVKSAVVRPVQE